MFTFILTFFVAYFFMYRVKFPPSSILLSEESALMCLKHDSVSFILSGKKSSFHLQFWKVFLLNMDF